MNNTQFPISKATLIFQDGNRKATINALDENTKLFIACRPTKHMVVIIEKQDAAPCYKLFSLNNKSHTEIENSNSEEFVCLLETPNKETILLSYTGGIYFLQTYDEEYSVTLYSVISSMLNSTQHNAKEEDRNVQEMGADGDRLLGVI